MGDVLLQESRTQLRPTHPGTSTIQQGPEQQNYTTLYLHEPNSFRPLMQLHREQGDNEKVYYYQLDHIGTPVSLTNAGGNIVVIRPCLLMGR